MGAHSASVTDPFIVIDKEAFDCLKDDERFWCLVTLARAVNSFRFCYSAFTSTSGNSNSAVRAKRSSFLFICALFTEAQTLVGNMGRYFRDFETFQELSRAINSQNAQALLRSNLRPVRNTQVFHFDPADTGKQLKWALLPTAPVFLSATGTTDGETYWELADLCAMSTFLGGPDLQEQGLPEIIDSRIRNTIDVTIKFVMAAESFLVDALENRSNWIMP
jgi:hypothetical protein